MKQTVNIWKVDPSFSITVNNR